ncbi:MAG: DUF3179 domain-containing (seleno)protein [Haloarculaceae archaeon]
MERRRGEGSRSDPEGATATSSASRRRFLAALGTGGIFATAGCLGGASSRLPFVDRESNSTPSPPREPSVAETYRDVELPVPESELARGAPKDTIAAITEPAFGPDWSGIEEHLSDGSLVIGVERDGAARAYPLKLLNWHEVVNDDFGGPLLVSYCPLCASGVVADRTMDGEALTFGVSGLLWRADLVMYDEATGSLWSQLLARAIRGELTGANLALYPSTTTTWGQWREAHPGTEVLLPPPDSNTVRGRLNLSYHRNPYLGYETSRRIGVGRTEEIDERLHPKTRVIGVAHDGVARAYTLQTLAKEGVVNDTVGGLPVVVSMASTTMVAYVRRIGGRTLGFDREDDVLIGGGSRWDIVSGRALDGPFEGRTLEPANVRSPMFWFAWADFYPDSEIYGQ